MKTKLILTSLPPLQKESRPQILQLNRSHISSPRASRPTRRWLDEHGKRMGHGKEGWREFFLFSERIDARMEGRMNGYGDEDTMLRCVMIFDKRWKLKNTLFCPDRKTQVLLWRYILVYIYILDEIWVIFASQPFITTPLLSNLPLPSFFSSPRTSRWVCGVISPNSFISICQRLPASQHYIQRPKNAVLGCMAKSRTWTPKSKIPRWDPHLLPWYVCP